jgi:heat shock protein HslJ
MGRVKAARYRLPHSRTLAALLLAQAVAAFAETPAGAAAAPPTSPSPASARAPLAAAPDGASGSPLENGVWQLREYRTAMGLRPVVTGEGRGYVAFQDGGFRINAGCDTLRGSYWLQRERLLFSPHVGSMLSDCPTTLRTQERTVLALLPEVARLRADDDGFALLDAEGQPVLTLQAPATASLQRRSWRLIAYRDAEGTVVPALPKPAITLRFDNAAQLSGRACDDYRGGFVRDARFLRLEGPLAGTKLGCAGDGPASRQAEDYLRALTQVDSYRVDAASLLLRDADGRMIARFSALGPADSTPQSDAPLPGDPGFAGSGANRPPVVRSEVPQ